MDDCGGRRPTWWCSLPTHPPRTTSFVERRPPPSSPARCWQECLYIRSFFPGSRSDAFVPITFVYSIDVQSHSCIHTVVSNRVRLFVWMEGLTVRYTRDFYGRLVVVRGLSTVSS